MIEAHGDIDAFNATALTDYVDEHALRCHALILDLTGLDFFGTEGFPTLHRAAVHCALAGIRWVVVPGAAVSHVLQLCDPESALPAARTVDAAMAIFRATIDVQHTVHAPQSGRHTRDQTPD